MILHENVNNPPKFRSDNYITRKASQAFLRPHLFAAKNKNSHSRVSFITLSLDRNILSFAKVQLPDINEKKRQKTLMFEIVFLNFFSFWSRKKFNCKVGKSSILVLSKKKCLTNFNDFWCQRASAKQHSSNWIYNSYSLHYEVKLKSTSLH